MPTNPECPERPIKTKTDDRLERGDFVRRLSEALVSSKTGKSTGVIIGLTGPWGSGKSSILNLLQGQIYSTHKNALIIRFDPWLISGNESIISTFLNEFIQSIKADESINEKLKEATKTISKYGEYVTPIGSLFNPMAGVILGGLVRIAKTKSADLESLDRIRTRLIEQLSSAEVPIVVLIDELDRVEDSDSEVRAIAHRVRSVADFPGVSYVLAYEAKRVIQALGSDAPSDEKLERGRNYLEKIVQFSIPLPLIFEEETARLIEKELQEVEQELDLPKNFPEIPRYRQILDILLDGVINTPRDLYGWEACSVHFTVWCGERWIGLMY